MDSKPSYGLTRELAETLCKHQKLADLFEVIVKQMWLNAFREKVAKGGYEVIE